MDFNQFLYDENEKPLDHITPDGGFCGIFRTIGCIGDSLASGEFESTTADGNKDYHDYFEYSWGQYIARAAGLRALNFSRGGMTAKEYWDDFAKRNGFWKNEKVCQAYIIALGVNDLFNRESPQLGSTADINLEDYNKNAETFAGYYARIIQRLKEMQPHAHFFLMAMPLEEEGTERNEMKIKHAALLHDMAELFDYTHVIDFTKYAPRYDAEFKKRFYLGGHMNPLGYMVTAKMTASYIDYIIRKNPEDFAQVGFIGTGYHNNTAKW